MNESPQEKLARLVGRQVDLRRRCGDVADVDAITAVTAKLLTIADAEVRTGANVRKDSDGKSAAEVRAQKRATGGESMAEEMGGEFYFRDLGEQPIVTAAPGAKVPSGVYGERHIAMMRRIKMLIARVPGYRRRPTDGAWAGNVYPRFAQLLDMNCKRAALDHPGRVGVGRYEGLSHEDRHRVFYNQLERICDLSNAVIQPGWWVSR